MRRTNPYIHTYYVNLRNGADIRRERQPLASGDKNADRFVVYLQDCGTAVSLDGAGVTGKVIRADGQTVPLTGTVSDGAAQITLDEYCYVVPGEIKLTVSVSAGDMVQSVLIVSMDVQTSETSVIVDNGVIGTLAELLAEIENMRNATAAAKAAANEAMNAALSSVRVDEAMLLSEEQMQTGRDNISVYSRDEVDALDNWIDHQIGLLQDSYVMSPNIYSLDMPGCVLGRYLTSSGQFSTNSAYNTSAMLEAAPGDVFRAYAFEADDLSKPTLRDDVRFSWYDADGNFLSQTLGSKTNTAPDETVFVRISERHISTGRLLAIVRNQTITEYTEAYAPVVLKPLEGIVERGQLGALVRKTLPIVVTSRNGFEKGTLVIGSFVTVGGVENASSTYCHTDYIEVHPGEVLRLIGTSGTVVGARFITAYGEGKKVLSDLGVDSDTREAFYYVVPEGVDYVIISMSLSECGDSPRVVRDANTDDSGAVHIRAANVPAKGMKPLITSAASLLDGETISLESNGLKKNKHLTFWGLIVGAFSSVKVGHGASNYGGSYAVVDASSITVYGRTNSEVQKASVAHGLTISGFLGVSVSAGHQATAKITVSTATGSFTTDDVPWIGSNGEMFAASTGSDFSDVRLTWFSPEYEHEVWVYGDSYVSHDTDIRWPHWLVSQGHTRFLLNGYPGKKSKAAYKDFMQDLTHGTPKAVVWAMGMNDPDDSGVVDSAWKRYVGYVTEVCAALNVTLILCTIPEVTNTSYSNFGKNAYVRASGLRYIDMAAAVSADSSSVWYDGMLDADGVHPTAMGAQALAARVAADAPEIMSRDQAGHGNAGTATYAKNAGYAERAGVADNALAVGGLAVQAVPITDWDTITPDESTVYLVYDAEVTA